MLRVNYLISYGEVKVKSWDGSKICTVKIHPANALCAFIHHYKAETGEKMAQLWNFLGDKQHIKNIMKQYPTLLGEDVVSVKLNVYYENARTLIEPMCKSGYKVTCYYKEPKKK
jgi:hypothetical protein